MCDVGSMDGADSLRFRGVLPKANILALKLDPTNFAAIQADEALPRNLIRKIPHAANDREFVEAFYSVRLNFQSCADFDQQDLRGMNLLSKRTCAFQVVCGAARRRDATNCRVQYRGCT